MHTPAAMEIGGPPQRLTPAIYGLGCRSGGLLLVEQVRAGLPEVRRAYLNAAAAMAYGVRID